jgi:hypothetical protein
MRTLVAQNLKVKTYQTNFDVDSRPTTVFHKNSLNFDPSTQVSQLGQFASMSEAKLSLPVNLNDHKIHQILDGFLEILLNLLAHRDYNTYLHSLRVAELAVRIGTQLGLSQEEILLLEHGAILLPNTTLLQAEQIACRICYLFNKLNDSMTSLSIGVASIIDGDAFHVCNLELLLNLADRQAYLVKNNGGNAISVGK